VFVIEFYWFLFHIKTFLCTWSSKLQDDSCHSHSQSVLHGSTSDLEHAEISVTSCFADLGACTNCQQGGLLQLGSRWYLWPSARLQSILNAAARLVFSPRQSTHNPITWWAPLVASSGGVTFRLCIWAYRCLHGTVLSYLAGSFLRTSDIHTQRRLRCADTAMLVVPSTRRSTFASSWLQNVHGTACVICQECTVADDVSSRAKDCTFSVIIWQSLGDYDCTAQYNCCLSTTTNCWHFCCVLFNCVSFVWCPCNVFDMIVSP